MLCAAANMAAVAFHRLRIRRVVPPNEIPLPHPGTVTSNSKPAQIYCKLSSHTTMIDSSEIYGRKFW